MINVSLEVQTCTFEYQNEQCESSMTTVLFMTVELSAWIMTTFRPQFLYLLDYITFSEISKCGDRKQKKKKIEFKSKM